MTYLLLKLIHLTSVVIFLGSIIVSLFWMQFAVKTRDAKYISHTIKGIITSDRYFTIPGVLWIVLSGILLSMVLKYPMLRTGWIQMSIVLFSISGVIFSLKVAPLQRSLFSLSAKLDSSSETEWSDFKKLYRSWEYWSLAALLTPFLAFVMMVLKIPG
jgi:uncharacterized membrane protein